MRERLRRARGAWLVAFAVAIAGGGVLVSSPPDVPPAGDTADLWVDTTTSGNTCARVADSEYVSNNACDSMQAAYTAANDGDTVRVKTGTYGVQSSIGGGADSVTFIGEDGAEVDSGTTNPSYNTFNLTGNVTVENVDVTGDFPIVQFSGDGNTWRDSSLTGDGIRTGSPCSDEPILLQSDTDDPGDAITNQTLQNLYVGPFKGVDDVAGGCADPDFHLEIIRIGRNVSDVLIDGVYFDDCPNGSGYVGCGSGHIFFTTASGASTWPQNITIRNSRFGSTPNTNFQNASTLPSGGDLSWNFEYNTFGNGEPFSWTSPLPASGNNNTWTGNLGTRPQTCWAGNTFTKNVWQWATGTPCGTDTRVTGDSFSTDQLGLDTDETLLAGSPAIDAGEAMCVATSGGFDFEGDARPLGSACDAGADERE